MNINLTTRDRWEIACFCSQKLRRFDNIIKKHEVDEQEEEFFRRLYDKMKVSDIAVNELSKRQLKRRK